MDIAELNQRLFALTPSEQRHRAGEPFCWPIPGSTAPAPGQPPRFPALDEFDRHRPPAADCDAEHASPLPPLVDGAVRLKRNSRFNAVPEHVHTYIELSYVYAGTCPQRVNGHELTLTENQVLLLDTDCPHAIAALGEGDIMVSVVVGKRFLREHLLGADMRASMVGRFLVDTLNEQTDHRRYVRFHSEHNRRIKRFFQELLCEELDPTPNSGAVKRLLIQLIFAELINVYEQDLREEQRATEGVSVVALIRYIEENWRTCTETGVAKRFYISPNYVSCLLKQHTGMNYRQLVQAQRMGYAGRLLRHTARPITEVARASGYENMSFFYRKFRETYGMSPRAWREQGSQSPGESGTP